MLSSSNEYLQALRAGKYLRFLEWPHFIQHYYYQDNSKLNADDLLTLLVFDWLNNGFCEEDAKQIALLTAVDAMESGRLRGNLAFSFTCISNAVFQCMVYQSCALQNQFINKDKMTRVEILKFMQQTSLDEATFTEHFQKQQKQFLAWSSGSNEDSVKAACSQISSIAEKRYILEDYIFAMEAVKLKDDQLKIARTSMVQKLSGYLNEQTELTEAVSQEVAIYVNKIREMQPSASEEDFLRRLTPLTISDNPWRIMTGLGLSFFSILQKPSQELATDQKKPGK